MTTDPTGTRMCSCPCGLTYDEAVQEVMRTSFVNRDQAKAWMDDAEAKR